MGAKSNIPPIQLLETKITNSKSVQDKIEALIQLAWGLRLCQPERAMVLCQEAQELAKSDSLNSYDKALAASLITLAFLESELGNLEKSISYSLEALSLLKDEHSDEWLIGAWFTLGWAYYYSGNYPAALDFGLKALSKAEETGSKEKEAWALDLVASTYKDPKYAVQLYRKALQLFEELDDIEGKSRVLNNLACTLLELGEYSAALESSQKSLQMAQIAKLKRDESNIIGTIGEILIAMGEYDQAQSHLQNAKLLVEAHGRDISYLYVMVDLGEVYLAQNKLDLAQQELLNALEIASQMEMPNEQARCYQSLSIIYEQKGQFDKALEHYKIFHSLKESIAGEGVIKQIAAMKMSHQVETAQRDAEIQRLQNENLQIELKEHKRMHIILENLATRDSLTNLYNRRYFLDLAEQEWQRTLRYRHPISVLMLDLDDFKQINDRFGHAAGDQALIMAAGIIQEVLRKVEIAGRYGGDEFAVLLPETPAEKSVIVANRILNKIIKQSIQTKAGAMKVTLSIGAAGFSDDVPDQIKTLNKLLHQADEALYRSKGAGKNKVSLYNVYE